jgi:hypothetical protein
MRPFSFFRKFLSPVLNFSAIPYEVQAGEAAWWTNLSSGITRADHLWVLHEPDFKPAGAAQSDGATFGNEKLVQTGPGVWEPALTGN